MSSAAYRSPRIEPLLQPSEEAPAPVPAAPEAVPAPARPVGAASGLPLPPGPGFDAHGADRRARWLGLVAVLVVFAGLGTWAAWAPLDSAAIGQGVISVENYRKAVQHLEGGIVREIKVRDGDSVARDQVLLVLDNTQLTAQLEVQRGQFFALLAREARLEAQRDGAARVAFPRELLAARTDTRAADAMRVQAQTFAARRQSHAGEVTLYQRQIEQLRAKAAGLTSQRTSREELVKSFESERADFEDLVRQGYIDRKRLREMERSLAQSEGQRGALVSDLAATELQVSETEVKILQLEKELQREVAKELAEVQTELAGVRERLRSLTDSVERMLVRAPDSGTVLGLAVHATGAVLRPGERILEIVPRNERLLVEAKLAPQDIDQVRPGQGAEVRFSNSKARELPRIDGRLMSVSADRLLDDGDGRRTPYYLARVEITPQGLQALQSAGLTLLPGMPAEVLVNTGERTLWQYLVAPFKDTMARSLRQK